MWGLKQMPLVDTGKPIPDQRAADLTVALTPSQFCLLAAYTVLHWHKGSWSCSSHLVAIKEWLLSTQG